ncbi:hypothetical protein ACIRPT_24350 [Streptomyces sp. NPDC101227]|uniref:hypothetical protein n=1 Tax=Streptomyces sp. NPDC101227 TaxID=3366136 RepID=UPI0038030A55
MDGSALDELLGDLLAGTTTPAPHPRNLARTLTRWQGRALLTWARVLQRTVAGLDRKKALTARRKQAMRAAHTRGIHRDTITATIGLSSETVRKALKGESTSE